MNQTNNDKIYQTNWQHLPDELTKLDMLIHLAVLRSRKTLQMESNDPFKDIYLSDREIDDILDEQYIETVNQNLDDEIDTQIKNLVATIEKYQKQLSQKREASLKEGIYLTLPQLSHLFGLNALEEYIVLICFAQELDRKYEKLYAYLQDDMTRKKASMDLIVKLLCSSREEIIAIRSCFLPRAPLFKHRILQFVENQQSSRPLVLTNFLKLDDRIVNFLLGINTLAHEIDSICELIFPRADHNSKPLFNDIKLKLLAVTQYHLKQLVEDRGSLIYYFYGTYGAGKQTLAEGICHELKVPLLIIHTDQLISGELPFEDTLRLVFRETILQPAAIYLKDFHCLLNSEENYQTQLKILTHIIEQSAWLTFLAGEKNWEPNRLFNRHSFMKVEFPIPNYTHRTQLWKEIVDGKYQFAKDVDFGTFATKFQFTGGQIEDAFIAAQNLARLRQPENLKITREDLYKGCRAQCNQKLGTLAQKISPQYKWDDIVLPQEILQQLHAICDQVKYRHRVYDEWGFDQKISLGKGINALFSGPSGTGKTMAAEIIATELQLDLYKIDLSSVVSKYIGETEKNLSKIFQEAIDSSAILFFDEADALFGKRSEVKDAHDRYANIEISYLLQKMEEYEGISILATNLKNNMDEAFLRRLHFLVEFPFPNDRYRHRIWDKFLPINQENNKHKGKNKNLPIDENIDFDFLATRFKITGGNIKNIAINAAFLAASKSEKISMEHILHATKQEYQKIGRPYIKSDFENYADVTMTKGT